jgi:proline dehydrogenase
MSGIVWAFLRPLIQRAGGSYVVGPDLADAVRACRFLDAQGFRSIIDFRNADNEAPQHITQCYVNALDAVSVEKLNCYVSVKARPLGFSRDLFIGIFERARQRDVGIHFDSLEPEAADQTFSLISELLPKYGKIGCTLPGRWRRSLTDADRAVDLHLNVRVIKGRWADLEEPEIDPRAGFLRIIDRLAGRVRHAAVATHDPVLAREALARLRAAGTPCELELLYGLPVRDAISAAEVVGVPVRICLPYGHALVPYNIEELRKNPRIIWWLLKDLGIAARLTMARDQSYHPRLPNKPP